MSGTATSTIYAQIHSYTNGAGTEIQTIAAQSTQPVLADGVTPDPAWAAYNVPDVSWLSISNGVIMAATSEPPANVAAAQAAAYTRINAAANAALAAIIAAYPELEVATWDQQLTEAQAYNANNAAATPLLSAISTTAGLTVAALAANVLAKNAAYKAASGAIIGQRLALSAQVATTTTSAAANAIVWQSSSQ
jgi:hypothetical protein